MPLTLQSLRLYVTDASLTTAATALERSAPKPEQQTSTMRLRKFRRIREVLLGPWVSGVAKFAVSAALVWFVCRNLSFDGLARRFIGEAPEWVLLAAATVLVQLVVAALRWQQILRALGLDMPERTVLSITYIGSFFNCWLPGNGSGDFARALLAPSGDRGRSTIVHSVLFDRMATLAGVGLTILPVMAANIGPLARGFPIVLSFTIVWLPFLALLCLEPIAPAIVRWQLPFACFAADLAQSWGKLRQRWRRFAMSLALGAASELVLTVTAYSLARAQHLDVSFVDFMALMPPVVLLGALPISIGGWGVRENIMVLALASIGIAAGPALLVGVQIGLLSVLMSLPGGAILLFGHVSRRAVVARKPLTT